jgi:hypothetical protein
MPIPILSGSDFSEIFRGGEIVIHPFLLELEGFWDIHRRGTLLRTLNRYINNEDF